MFPAIRFVSRHVQAIRLALGAADTITCADGSSYVLEMDAGAFDTTLRVKNQSCEL
ncbi:MAG: hypothetical protein ACREBW_06100 [Candidatus Micrarchaeaceae archaeon]